MTTPEKIKAIQTLLGVKADGAFGPLSMGALKALISPHTEPADVRETSPGAEFDELTERNLATLNAPSQVVFRQFLRKLVPYMAAQGVVAKIISGTRTYKEQDALYAKGRTAPGPRVTNARGGQSNHNFGCAADIGLFKGGDYLEDSPLYLEAGPIGESVGLSWGGRWKSIKDYPHFEALEFKSPVR